MILGAFCGLIGLLPAACAAEDVFVPLFDGQTLSGWHKRGGLATFAAQAGTIIGTSAANSPNTFLCTTETFNNFVLVYEFKCDAALNSGVQFRSQCFEQETTDPRGSEPLVIPAGRVHGYQVEIDPDKPDRMWCGGIYDEARRGWLYPGIRGGNADEFTQQGQAVYRRDDWNSVKVVCQGDHIRTWLNGQPRADFRDDWNMRGFIALQVHGVGERSDPLRIRFRNIRLMKLDDAEDGWVSLFNGQDLTGWRVNEHPESVRVEDGCIVTNGERAHVFYIGPQGQADFKNFHFQAMVKTMPQANSGIYFHTRFLPSDWPDRGYEAQVNNSQGDPQKTGGLYDVQPNEVAPVDDREWFRYEILVEGRHIVVKINGNVVSDYTEPEDLERPERQLSSGTFALQAHDPGSKVYYKDIRVKVLD